MRCSHVKVKTASSWYEDLITHWPCRYITYYWPWMNTVIYTNLYSSRLWPAYSYIMHDDVRVMIKGAKDGILAFVYSIRLTKTLRIKKLQAQLDYLSIATSFDLKLIFIIYTDDTHEYGMHVILQDVVIVYQYTQPLFKSHLVRKYLYNIIYQYMY